MPKKRLIVPLARCPENASTTMFQYLKDSKRRPEIQRFHHTPSIIQKKYRILLKHKIDLLRFTYVLRLSTIMQDLLRFHHRMFPFLFKTLGDTDWIGPTRK